MEKFVMAIREIFYIILWFTIVLSFIGGVGELDDGGGGLAGGALIAGSLLIASARMRPSQAPPSR